MTALDRLIAAEGVAGGVIHSYNRMFGRDVTAYTAENFGDMARTLMAEGKLDLARLASKASVAHMTFNRVG